MYPKLASSSCVAEDDLELINCLFLLSAGITDVCHPVWFILC